MFVWVDGWLIVFNFLSMEKGLSYVGKRGGEIICREICKLLTLSRFLGIVFG